MNSGRPLQTLIAVSLLLGTTACGSFKNLLGGTDVDAVASSAEPPANVFVYLEVSEDGEPVTELEPKHFTVYENDQALSSDAIGLTVLPREAVTHERLLLLVDYGANPSAELKSWMARGVENFLERVQGELAVTVLAYDGSPGLRMVGDYPRAASGAKAPDVSKLESLEPRDASRDLYGALIKGARELDVRLMQQKKPVRLGTIVLVARGADLAGRNDAQQAREALEAKGYDLILLTVGELAPELEALADAGVVRAHAEETLPIAFEEAASRAALNRQKYYLVAYCSPARAGKRGLRLELSYVGKDNDERGASYYQEFDASGFGPGCSPNTLPRFVQGRRSAPATETSVDPADATRGEPDEGAPEVAPPPDRPEYQ